VDKSAALNAGPMDGCLCFPFPLVTGKEPGSAVGGLACPKTEPVCGVGGDLVVQEIVSGWPRRWFAWLFPITLQPELCLLFLPACYVR